MRLCPFLTGCAQCLRYPAGSKRDNIVMIRSRFASKKIVREKLSGLEDPDFSHRIVAGYPELFSQTKGGPTVAPAIIITLVFWLAIIAACIYGHAVAQLSHPIPPAPV
jgi:hypothetical protein